MARPLLGEILLENGEISLIKWNISTTEDGTLKVIRILLEGPQKINAYKTSFFSSNSINTGFIILSLRNLQIN